MVTSVALGLVICFEPHEFDVMTRSPRAVGKIHHSIDSLKQAVTAVDAGT